MGQKKVIVFSKTIYSVCGEGKEKLGLILRNDCLVAVLIIQEEDIEVLDF